MVEEKLVEYADVLGRLDGEGLLRDALLEQFPRRFGEIEEAFKQAANRREALEKQAADLKKDISAVVIRDRVPIRTSVLDAVYVGGRTSWDSKKLEGYAAAHPEVLAFRKAGAPYVVFRKTKKQG